jgi:hypothetical protein
MSFVFHGSGNGSIKNVMRQYFGALSSVVAGLSIGFIVAGNALAAPTGVALVVGNAAYTGLPPLPGCALSARAVAAALKDQGYDVTERSDVSTGQLDAAAGILAEKLSALPNVPTMVHICGYVAGLAGRPFLVPVSAALVRPSDVLTQGMLAKSIVDVVAHSGPRDALVLLEAVPLPTATEPLALEALDRPDLPARMSLLAVTEPGSGSPTPLSTAMMPRFKGSPLAVAPLIDGIGQDLAGLRTASVVVRRVPAAAGFLAGGPPVVPPPLAVTPPVVVAPPVIVPPVVINPPSPVVVSPPVVDPPPVPSPAPGLVNLPDESVMTDAERRTVQTALAKLGYYPGPIDGVFGPETRAAIRRLQHEVQAPMSGHLTAEQARRLMTLR